MLIDHFRSSNSKRKGTETQRHFSSREDALDKHVLTRVVTNQIIPTWYTFISNIKNKYGYNNYRKMIFRVKSLTPIHHMYKQPIVSQNMRSILHVQKKKSVPSTGEILLLQDLFFHLSLRMLLLRDKHPHAAWSPCRK
jgi:hypothetical protein